MENETIYNYGQSAAVVSAFTEAEILNNVPHRAFENSLAEILFITSYPPRECGIATYSQDLINALNTKFGDSFSINVCALENGKAGHKYPSEVKYILDTTYPAGYTTLAKAINTNTLVKTVVIEHEFGFYEGNEDDFMALLRQLDKPVVLAFHTVLPHPDETLKQKVINMVAESRSVLVMTNSSAQILINDYQVDEQKISVIAHGTHLVPHLDKEFLKEKYKLTGRKVLSTFGLLSPGKGIETTLKALPEVVKTNPEVLFLIIGKTHPGIVKSEGEKYRTHLESLVEELHLYENVMFINRFIKLPELLEYLQMTDVYLFTSRDPLQAVSGTFSYAISSGCPIISTPIPHAREVLQNGTGILIDFDNSTQLTDAIARLLNDEQLRKNTGLNGLHLMASTVWENSAIAHALLFEKMGGEQISLDYAIPPFNSDHIKKMTTDIGIFQFSKLNTPDPLSGYTLDDNARALVTMCEHYELTGEQQDIEYIRTYLNFINFCQQHDGSFLNYVDGAPNFTPQNDEANLSDANGRAIWALGLLVSKRAILPQLVAVAEQTLLKTLPLINNMHSTRAMAFAIKGLYFYNFERKNPEITELITILANRLLQMYRHESEQGWEWFESYLTYANSILPEAMLYAWLETGEPAYEETAKYSLDFLLRQTFNGNGIKVISNRSWLHKGLEADNHGEQPIDVAYTILTLSLFYNVFKDGRYLSKMKTAFNWFLGQNHLHQIIYNPCTGGCYDGLEETHVNLNQGAESTLSYAMARLCMEKWVKKEIKSAGQKQGTLTDVK